MNLNHHSALELQKLNINCYSVIIYLHWLHLSSGLANQQAAFDV